MVRFSLGELLSVSLMSEYSWILPEPTIPGARATLRGSGGNHGPSETEPCSEGNIYYQKYIFDIKGRRGVPINCTSGKRWSATGTRLRTPRLERGFWEAQDKASRACSFVLWRSPFSRAHHCLQNPREYCWMGLR